MISIVANYDAAILKSWQLCLSFNYSPKNDFEHARGPRNSDYAVNLIYDRHTDIHTDIHTNIHTNIHIYTRKMVPITGRASPTLGCSIEISHDIYIYYIGA